MIEYEVGINGRPLGVRFAHADRGETVVVHLVLEGKIGDELGLQPGDILISVNSSSILNMTSAEALEVFRNQKVPFKAAFRRFEDDDDFSEDESDSEQTQFLKEETSHLMSALASHRKSKSVQLGDWSVDDVLDWLTNYGRALGDADRFKKYAQLFRDNNISGKILRGLDRIDLAKMGIDDTDCHDLFVGIRELNNIISVTHDQLNKTGTMKTKPDGLDEEEDSYEGDSEADSKQEEDDNWEAPFLPYMYDAPAVKLSAGTIVTVSNARVVSPYKKKPFALYEIEVVDGDNEWLLSKRYTEFRRVQEAMVKLGIKPKSKFPAKGLFNNSTDKKVMENRQIQLTAYLNSLLKDHPEGRASKELNDFLSPSRTFVVDQ